LVTILKFFSNQELDEMAFEGDEEQLSSKKEELASLDGRHKTIMERLKSKSSFLFYSEHIHTGQIKKLWTSVGIEPVTFGLTVQRSIPTRQMNKSSL
jgi:hypothetical protein